MVSIYDIAKEAKVSIATVSNVINKKNNEVGSDTKKKVLAVMEKLSYIPSKAAINLAKGNTKVIGVVVSDINNPFFSELVREIENSLYSLDFELFLLDTGYDIIKSKELVKKLVSTNVEGVLMLNNEVDNDLALILSKHNIPTILYSWDITGNYLCNLKIDFCKGIKKAIKTLYELNHRRIIFIESEIKLKTFTSRKEAFTSAIKELNLKDLQYISIKGESTVFSGQRIAREILRNKNFAPTAVMTINDIQAISVLFAFLDLKINIPDDISLIGLDNIYLANIIVPKLTTIDLSAKRVGQKVISMLIELIENQDKSGFERVIETKFILRDTIKKLE
ncbi:MAG: LacI family DNA-binding transcriptional regulator [Candidatus Humimicrobiaceae bacterium]